MIARAGRKCFTPRFTCYLKRDVNFFFMRNKHQFQALLVNNAIIDCKKDNFASGGLGEEWWVKFANFKMICGGSSVVEILVLRDAW